MNYDENGKYYVKLHGHRELEELCQLVAFDAGVYWAGGCKELVEVINSEESHIGYNLVKKNALTHGDSNWNSDMELIVPEWIGFFKWLKERKADNGEGWTKESVMKKFDKLMEELKSL